MEKLKFISDEEIVAIHNTTLRILSEIGFVWTHKPSLDILTSAGCTIKGNRVYFPPQLVEDCIKKSGKTVTIARDTAIPASRNCPAHYDIDSVHSPASYGSEALNVVFIGTYTRGFEGWDRQVTALPFAMVD